MINVVSGFDGISNAAYALVQMGHKGFNYYAYEIDKNAIAIARYNAKKYSYFISVHAGVWCVSSPLEFNNSLSISRLSNIKSFGFF